MATSPLRHLGRLAKLQLLVQPPLQLRQLQPQQPVLEQGWAQELGLGLGLVQVQVQVTMMTTMTTMTLPLHWWQLPPRLHQGQRPSVARAPTWLPLLSSSLTER